MTDLDLAYLSRDSYRPAVPGLIRIEYQDMSADIIDRVVAVRGTRSYANAKRDMEISPALCRSHPDIGLCVSGALDAALGLLPQIPDGVDTVTGHSLGGQVAVILAAMLGDRARLLVTWDAPKAGGLELAAALSGLDVRQYRFRGSVVGDWPFCLDRHVRPLIPMGDWTLDPIEAHSIDRACGWLAARVEAAA